MTDRVRGLGAQLLSFTNFAYNLEMLLQHFHVMILINFQNIYTRIH